VSADTLRKAIILPEEYDIAEKTEKDLNSR
jgi:hypothetical protein